MAGPAPIATGINEDTRRLLEEEKKKLEMAKQEKSAMPSPNMATQAPVSQLEGRKELADILKKAAREEIGFDPQALVKSGESLGVSRSQISDLFGKYRSEFKANLPEGYTPRTSNTLGESATGLKYASQFETQKPATSPTPVAPVSPTAPAFPTLNLDRLAAMQNEPMGSVSIGATGVQGAVGGLAQGQSRTGGTPIGRGSSRDRNVQIAVNILGRAYRERQRTAAELKAEEDAYNRVYGVEEFGIKKMPYFNK
jgi:hypothetical protein